MWVQLQHRLGLPNYLRPEYEQNKLLVLKVAEEKGRADAFLANLT